MIPIRDLPKDIPPGSVAIVGIPYDENSSFLRGSAEAPGRIRQALHSESTNLCTEEGIDLSGHPGLHDLGDVDLSTSSRVLDTIETYILELLQRDVRALSLGGDHAVTLPIVRAFARTYSEFSILQFDAHPDLYDTYEGNRYSHACPFARIMEENPRVRLVQLGIRTMNPHQQAQADRFGVETIHMKSWAKGMPVDISGPVYVSLDLDVLDPAFAPGVSHHEPGGMATRDVLEIIQGFQGPVIGCDIVELNPSRDVAGMTAMVAAKFLKELAGKMLL